MFSLVYVFSFTTGIYIFIYMAAVLSLWSTAESDEVHSGVSEKALGMTQGTPLVFSGEQCFRGAVPHHLSTPMCRISGRHKISEYP